METRINRGFFPSRPLRSNITMRAAVAPAMPRLNGYLLENEIFKRPLNRLKKVAMNLRDLRIAACNNPGILSTVGCRGISEKPSCML
jgi:hypothetical protein